VTLSRPVPVAPKRSGNGAAATSWESTSWWSRRRTDVAGVLAIVIGVGIYLSPALKDGFAFGPFDLGSLLTIGHAHPLVIHNRLNGDLVTQMIPWNTLDWRLVHAGQLPLWNSFSLLGTPQAFNFESAAASLPDLVGYLVPLKESFLVVVAMKLLIAGTGTYATCRVLGLAPVASVFGGITFMYSGAFSSWLGWPLTDVVAWTGWIVALAILVYRGRARRHVLLLAVAVAFACYGGFPEAYALMALCIAALLGGTGLAKVILRHRVEWRGVLRMAVAAAAGLALAAPLLLPGAQLLRGSVRTSVRLHDSTMHATLLSLAVAPGYFGLPLHGSVWFGPSDYYETVAYVGLVALVLSAVGMVCNFRRPAAVGIFALVVAALAASYHLGGLDPGAAFFNGLHLGAISSTRARVFAGFGVAVLGAFGLQRLLVAPTRAVRLTFLAASVVVAGVVAALCVVSAAEHLVGTNGVERLHSLIWPVGVGALLVVVALAVSRLGAGRSSWSRGQAWLLAAVLLGAESASLLAPGIGINSYSTTFLPSNPSLSRLQGFVGTGLVGLDGRVTGTPRSWSDLGLYPNVNVGYALDEFVGHDPVLPAGYFESFGIGRKSRPTRSSVLVPDIDSVKLARYYGIGWLLVAPGTTPPVGTTFVAKLDSERLYEVPGSARFSFPAASGDEVLGSRQTSDRAFSLRVRTPHSATLVIRVTDVPGWTVTDAGRSLPVKPFGRVMMSVVVPAGTTALQLSYWPASFTDGLVAALATALGLAGWAAWPARRRRGRRARLSSDPASPGSSPVPESPVGPEPSGAGPGRLDPAG